MIPWNKGLTKETDERLKNVSNLLRKWYKNNPEKAQQKSLKQAKTLKKTIKNGKYDIRHFKGKKHSIKSKQKISKSMKKAFKENRNSSPMKNSKIARKQSKSLKIFYKKYPEKHPNFNQNTISKPQKELYKTIKKEFITAKLNYVIKTNDSIVFADIAIPETKLDVEFDGFYIHRTKEGIERDRRRDIKLKQVGWKTIRFNYENLKNKEEVKNIVRTEVIKRIEEIGARNTFDITTQKNHNFILENGILSHNCHPQLN